jgi:hypothetical protein
MEILWVILLTILIGTIVYNPIQSLIVIPSIIIIWAGVGYILKKCSGEDTID